MVMIKLRPALLEELETFNAMDRQDHVGTFLTRIGLETHQAFFDDPNTSYLSIEDDSGQCCGYLTLVHEQDSNSIELRRILVDRHSRGIGQMVMAMAEKWCQTRYDIDRIWLDVFDDNARGRHVYTKLGYTLFKTTRFKGKLLHHMEKML